MERHGLARWPFELELAGFFEAREFSFGPGGANSRKGRDRAEDSGHPSLHLGSRALNAGAEGSNLRHRGCNDSALEWFLFIQQAWRGYRGAPMDEKSQSTNGEKATPVATRSTDETGASIHDQGLAETTPAKPSQPTDRNQMQRRRLLMGGLAIVVLAIAAVFGVPWMREILTTVSTDDAYVNGHVTFVAARVPGQESKVLVDDNNRVSKGDLLVELDGEPYRVEVALKKAAVDTAKADLDAAKANVRGVEARARSQRWKLQHAIEDVENQIALLHAKIAFMRKLPLLIRATLR